MGSQLSKSEKYKDLLSEWVFFQ